MTVTHVPDNLSSLYSCVWFAGHKREQGTFPGAALQAYTEEKDKKEKKQ